MAAAAAVKAKPSYFLTTRSSPWTDPPLPFGEYVGKLPHSWFEDEHGVKHVVDEAFDAYLVTAEARRGFDLATQYRMYKREIKNGEIIRNERGSEVIWLSPCGRGLFELDVRVAEMLLAGDNITRDNIQDHQDWRSSVKDTRKAQALSILSLYWLNTRTKSHPNWRDRGAVPTCIVADVVRTWDGATHFDLETV